MASVSSTSQIRAENCRNTLTERCPVTVVATTAPAAVTPNAGSDASTAAKREADVGRV